jgi:pimeloyl-ACP methyl ester carboxylesterase
MQVTARRRRTVIFTFAAVIAIVVALIGGCTSDDDGNTGAGADFTHVATEPCADSRFECVTLAVPRDHFSGDSTTWEVTFGIQRAAVEAKGTFVTITGGPGSSGLLLAEPYTDVMAQEITDNFDIVFLDQRGIGASQPLRCDEAAAAYYRGTSDPSDPAQRDQVEADTQSFVGDCLAETGADEGDLPYYSTVQAVEDLEAFRKYLGVEQLHLYGESYGTQYVQTYAAAHPDRVASLIVDGVVDLTVDVLDYYVEGARAHDDALIAILADCTADEVCAADADADALAVWDSLDAQLDEAPIEYEYPMPDGSSQTRSFTATDLDLATVGFIGSLGDRMLLQRAIAAASSGNLVPLARMAYGSTFVDPETLEVTPDPSWSDAMYYAVECQDYDFFSDAGSERRRIDMWIDTAVAAGIDEFRLNTIAFGDLPCLLWPGTEDSWAIGGSRADRPDPIVDPPYPTLVLTADTDAATPVANAMRVFSRLENSHLIVLQGGPHVIFDWGYMCVDELVSTFIATGEPPPTRVTICDGEVADTYAPIAPVEADDYDDAIETMAIIEAQLFASTSYTYWDGVEPLAEGCDFGGSVEYVPTDVGTDVTLDACEFTDGYAVSGSGSSDSETGAVHLEVEVPDGELSYENDGASVTVTGTFEGQEVAAEA